MANILITDELLALFLEGKTTVNESAAILDAAKEELGVRYFLDSAIENGMFFYGDIMGNPSSQTVGELYALHSKHAPVMRLAANKKVNDCIVKCEEYVLRERGQEASFQKLSKEARQHNWINKEGTPLLNIGRLLEMAKLSVARRFGGNIELIQSELENGCSVIVTLNAKLLANPTSQNTDLANNAVVILEVNTSDNYVEIYDPLSSNPTDRYSMPTFLKAWSLSKYFFISIIERGIRPYTPHPEDVSRIKLPKEIESIADILAENALETWAKDHSAEAEKNQNKDIVEPPCDDPFMKPFSELTKQKSTFYYVSSLNTIKLIYRLGFTIIPPCEKPLDFKSNSITPDGKYVPNPIFINDVVLPSPINIDDVVLPEKIENLTEYIAENAHEEWAEHRIREGWTFAHETNNALKQSCELVPYCELIDSEKECNRKIAKDTLKLLYKLGYKIQKNTANSLNVEIEQKGEM